MTTTLDRPPSTRHESVEAYTATETTNQLEEQQHKVDSLSESLRIVHEIVKQNCEQTPVGVIDNLPGGVTLYGKYESLQNGGSFKTRSAFVQLAAPDSSKHKKVCCASAGNFGKGVAIAAKKKQIKATVYMPTTVNPARIQAITEAGTDADGICWAEVESVGQTVDEALAAAHESGVRMLEPFNDELTILAHGTPMLEAKEQLGDTIQRVFVTVGGGSLAAGSLQALFDRPNVEVVIVQFEGNDSAQKSVQAGKPTPATAINKLAAGSAVTTIGDKPLAVLLENQHRIRFMTVSQAEVGSELTQEINDRHQYYPVYGDATYEGMSEVTGIIAQTGARKLAKELSNEGIDISREAWLAIISGSNVDQPAELACQRAAHDARVQLGSRACSVVSKPFTS